MYVHILNSNSLFYKITDYSEIPNNYLSLF